MTWIVYRIVKDKRCLNGERWLAIGWVNHANEQQASAEAHKMFRNYDQEQLRLVVTKPGTGWLI